MIGEDDGLHSHLANRHDQRLPDRFGAYVDLDVETIEYARCRIPCRRGMSIYLQKGLEGNTIDWSELAPSVRMCTNSPSLQARSTVFVPHASEQHINRILPWVFFVTVPQYRAHCLEDRSPNGRGNLLVASSKQTHDHG